MIFSPMLLAIFQDVINNLRILFCVRFLCTWTIWNLTLCYFDEWIPCLSQIPIYDESVLCILKYVKASIPKSSFAPSLF